MTPALALLGLVAAFAAPSPAEPVTRLWIEQDLVDLPEMVDAGPAVPTMGQSLQAAANTYDLGYLGIDALGDLVVSEERHPFWNAVVEQPVAGVFVHFGRELPIPLGVWAHEEYHRAALREGGVRSLNGNGLLSRWNGTVYGVKDADLAALKARDPALLVRSFSAGVETQLHLTRSVTATDFRWRRDIPRSLLLLDNAWYVLDYFRLAAGPKSDIVKDVLLEYAGATEYDRDFAGNDLTAWARDLWRPDEPYEARGEHPFGSGLARPVGWSDLTEDEQRFLRRQRDLAWLDFVNPAAFFVRRFAIGEGFAFNAFVQHVPTSFGFAIDGNVLLQVGPYAVLASVKTQFSRDLVLPGFEVEGLDLPVSIAGTDLLVSPRLMLWLQPEGQRFDAEAGRPGGLLGLRVAVPLEDGVSMVLGAEGKSRGFVMGDPHLAPSFAVTWGVRWAWAPEGDVKGRPAG